jgi:hypothetical protein
MKRDNILIKTERTPAGTSIHRRESGHSILQMTGIGAIQEIEKDVKDLKQGDRVVWVGEENSQAVNISQEFVARVPDELSDERAVFAGVWAYVAHNIREANINFGERLVIYRDDLIGMIAFQVLSLFGCYPENLMDFNAELGDGDTSNADGAIISTFCDLDLSGLLATLHKRAVCIIFDETNCIIPARSFQEKAIGMIFANIPGRNPEDTVSPRSYKRWTMRREMELCMALLLKKQIDVR